MFPFFRNKKTVLTTIFPKNFVDIHSHLLPGIDDGSKSMDETVGLLKKMYSYGISHFIFTPHIMEGLWENTPASIQAKLSELKTHLHTIGMTDIHLSVAAEYMLDANFNHLLKAKTLLPLKDTKILIEMSYLNAPINLYETLFDIQIAGYQPLLAHPERYSFYHHNFKAYYKLKEAGCLFQLNLLSLSNYYGKGVQEIAIRLLKENLIDFVGTDTHRMQHLTYLEQINNRKIIKLIAPILENNAYFVNNLV